MKYLINQTTCILKKFKIYYKDDMSYKLYLKSEKLSNNFVLENPNTPSLIRSAYNVTPVSEKIGKKSCNNYYNCISLSKFTK
jgi:hypothetical protein